MTGVNYDAAMSGLSKYPKNTRNKLSNGYEYDIAYYTDSEGDMFKLTIKLLDDKTANAIIMRSPKTVMYEYDLEGATRGSSIPYAYRQRIASDFESVGVVYQAEQEADTRTDEEKFTDSVLEAERLAGGRGAIFTQPVYTRIEETTWDNLNISGMNNDVAYTLDRGVGTISDKGVMESYVRYQFNIYLDYLEGGQYETKMGAPYQQDFDNQVDAETHYQTSVDEMNAQIAALLLAEAEPARTSVLIYEQYEVIWNNYGGELNQYQLFNDGELNGTYDVGDTLQGRDDSGEYPVNVTVELPEWNWDDRTAIITAWEKILNMRVEGKYVRNEVYEVETVEWYQQNIGARNNPFEYLDTAGELTKDGIGGAQGVMLDDVDFTNPFDPKYSGGLRLAVRNGYTVTLVLRTENFGYFVDNIEGLETTGLAYGGDFINPHPRIQGGSVNLLRDNGYGGFTLTDDEVGIQLMGGDSFAVDIDGRYNTISDFSIIIEGKEYAKSGYKEVDDEFSVGIIGVSFSQGDVVPDLIIPPVEEIVVVEDEVEEEKTSIDSKAIIIVVIGVIAVAVLWNMFRTVGEE